MEVYRPHEYQNYSKDYIIGHPSCGLFLDMGLGKTSIALTAIDELMYEHMSLKRVLIIAPPKVAQDTWPEEINKWEHLKNLRLSMCLGNEKKRVEGLLADADVYVVSNSVVDWLIDFIKKNRLFFGMLVIDELSAFKSTKSNRFRSLKKIRPFFKRVVGLTGTPVPNGLIDLWPQIYLLDQGERLGKTVTNYRSRYFYPLKYNGHIVYEYGLQEGAEDKIYQAVSDITVSMKNTDYLNMPERIDNIVKVRMSPQERRLYDTLKREYCLELEGKDILADNAAVLSGKLLQMASGAIYDVDSNVIEIHSRKLLALDGIIEEANGKKLLLVYQYKHSLKRIYERYGKKLDIREYKCPNDKKDWNNGKIDILLIHPKACKYGLNLQHGGSTMLWYDLTWSLDDYLQTNARLWRQGQKDTVIIHHLACEGTIDEKVLLALQNKEITQESLINAVKAEIRSD